MIFVKQVRCFTKYPDGVPCLIPISMEEEMVEIVRIQNLVSFRIVDGFEITEVTFDLQTYVKLSHKQGCVCATGPAY